MKISGVNIKGISSNSKEIKKDFAFVAIKGSVEDGSRFIREALDRGARLIVAEKKPCLSIPAAVKLLCVKDARKFLGTAAHHFYGCPTDKVKVVGITGTNGKTTISYLIEAIAKESGRLCGVIGTINYRFKGRLISATNTTPGACRLQSLLGMMRSEKVNFCAMEVSSHALDQERVWGINFSSAIFTNLTQDHLDYHKNMANYFQAKSTLFKNLAKKSFAVINNDDKYATRLKKITRAHVITYGINKRSRVQAKDIEYGSRGSSFALVAPGINTRIKTHLTGSYNIYNILAAVAWAISEKFPLSKIKAAIEQFKNVPGRLERIPNKKELDIFVDYAHTPDALINVLSTLRPLVRGKLVVVFGCGGQRDKLKRPLMGEISTRLSDLAVITSDNPRLEEPAQIISDIERGIKKNNYLLIPDRASAIRKALAFIRPGDCLLIAGKGHEDYQIIKNKVLKFSDRKAVKKCLESMN